MAFLGLIIAVLLFLHFKRRHRRFRLRYRHDDLHRAIAGHDWQAEREQWRERVREERRRWRAAARQWKRGNFTPPKPDPEQEALRRARRRAAVEASFYVHLMWYLAVMAFLAFINLMTTAYPWFLWPALGWGIGLFSHYMGVFGSRFVRERFFDPAVEREVRREKQAMTTDKQASIEELSATIAHEIRNPIAAAKSLVQQMGEDPHSVENVEYAKVAIEELDRVERRVSHLLKYAKEEEYRFAHTNLAGVVDAALTQLRSKLDSAQVQVARNYIAGPTVWADAEKLQQVFGNIIDNAIDALAPVAEGRRLDLFIENGTPKTATVRIRDNGCGIPEAKLAKIFNPFFTTKEKGTGLGMAIAKKIVDAHQGHIGADSVEGRGSEFRVTLPTP
ncbi:MAG: 2TM domain-containing protein [Deltaproteobacteria bacterium]|nr:2TM domain-containing protein [Deltaproteobacteria bacterium]